MVEEGPPLPLPDPDPGAIRWGRADERLETVGNRPPHRETRPGKWASTSEGTGEAGSVAQNRPIERY